MLNKLKNIDFKSLLQRAAQIRKRSILIAAVVLLLAVAAVVNAIRAGRDTTDGGNTPASVSTVFETDETYPLAVYFIDVGQGDSMIVKAKDTVLMIDGGEREIADVTVNYLKTLGINTVDCYVATHPHSDHIGAAQAIFSAVNVKNVMMTAFSEINTPTTACYSRLLSSVESEHCKVIIPEPGESYTFGPLKLDVFAPLEETSAYNNMSIVFKMTYGRTSFLFTGDAQIESEQLMLEKGFDLHADVLKLGHHGSSDATGPEFFQAVNPRIAVISCGKNNDYGHPHWETLSLLKNAEIDYYRTDEHGTVTIYGDGKDIFVKG